LSAFARANLASCPLTGLRKLNGLLMAVRRGRLDLDRVARFANDLAALPIRMEPPHAPAAWDAMIRLAARHQLTVYDAAYLELAQRTALPLATLDRDLRRAALAVSVNLMET